MPFHCQALSASLSDILQGSDFPFPARVHAKRIKGESLKKDFFFSYCLAQVEEGKEKHLCELPASGEAEIRPRGIGIYAI